MTDAERAIALYQRKAGFALKIKAALSTIIMLLTLLTIGILAVPAFIFISIIGVLWDLADKAIRAIDS